MASLEKVSRTGGTAYCIRYRLDGKYYTEYLPINTPPSHARAIHLEFNRRLAMHKIGTARFISPIHGDRSPVSVQEFQKWFLENKKTAIRRGRSIHPRTLKVYEYAFARLVEAVGNSKISLSPQEIRKFENHLTEYGPSSRSIIIRSLRAAWEFGEREGIISDNPFRRISVSKERKTPTILTNDEKDRIFVLIKHNEVRLGFALARYAGLRRVEICRNVKWEGVDFESGLLTIPEGKTGQNQIVPILPPLAEILKASQQPEGFIVSIGETTLTHAIERARREAGINKPGAVRILRHSLGHGLLTQGVDIRVIQLLLRHSDISTTQIYTRIPADSVRDMLAGKKV